MVVSNPCDALQLYHPINCVPGIIINITNAPTTLITTVPGTFTTTVTSVTTVATTETQ